MTDAEAEAMLAQLREHYRQPVLPVGHYCKALETWAEVYLERFPSYREAFASVRISIVKSNLLARLIYDGQKLRTRQCPIHKGTWSGCVPEPCEAGCSDGMNLTGWLPEPEDEERLAAREKLEKERLEHALGGIWKIVR